METASPTEQTSEFIEKFRDHYYKKHPEVLKPSKLLELIENSALSENGQPMSMVHVSEIEELLKKNLQRAFKPQQQNKSGILIIGAPGVGKTAFMRYYVRKNQKVLINMSCCDLVSILKEQVAETIDLLFEMANFSEETILFFDEIDMLFNPEHQYPLIEKAKETLLKNITRKDYNTPIVYSTNRPWKLENNAFLNTIYYALQVPLLEAADRRQLIENILKSTKDVNTSKVDIDECVKKSENYTNSDIYVLIKAIIFEPITELLIEGKPLSEKQEVTVQPKHQQKAFEKIKGSLLIEEIHEYNEWKKKFESIAQK